MMLMLCVKEMDCPVTNLPVYAHLHSKEMDSLVPVGYMYNSDYLLHAMKV